ncbi:hypothetical protein BSK20_05565 [SR1 bacterium human oral taxon HOT-345]|nr:hypothetical protein BSK20_05565 [SR1 bacterium human oral taxon HOT-345]
MRYRSYESSSPKRMLAYFLGVMAGVRVAFSLILGYQFLVENGEKTNQKGGTFVEAFFDQISYLPYLRNDGQSLFYQSLLFDACIDYTTLNEQGLQNGQCRILTQDYQTYYVSEVGTGKSWSDGEHRGLDDIFFTYDRIIRQNVWNIKSLNAYHEISVEKEDGKIKVKFPTSTTDNNYFFTFSILPRHILEHAQMNDYTSAFAAGPITSACGKIVPKSSDGLSLVFNLMQCQDTNFAYYQIKKYPSFEDLSRLLLENGKTIVDAYTHQVQLPNYKTLKVIKTDLLTLFFNTKSPKMKVRLRRALAGLINSKFYVGDEYGKFLWMYKGGLLKKFYSDGSNIKEFINRAALSEKEGVQQQDLQDSGVLELKKSISINGVERKFVFYTPKSDATFNLEIKFSNQFETIKIKDAKGHEFSPKNYKKTDKKVVYPLENGKNLNPGLNQYTIVGSIKGKTYTIANIDLYVLATSTQEKDDTSDWKVKVLYYNSLESNFAVKQLRTIFEKAGILENFLFEQVSSPEQFEAKIVLGEYDILLNTINMGMKKDLLKVLMTDDVMANPSKYTNPNLSNYFKQYTKNPEDSQIASEINAIYAQDMPLIILGHPYNFVNIEKSLISSDFGSGITLYEYNWRKYLYSQVALIKNTEINFKKIKDIRGFLQYLQSKSGVSFPLPEMKTNVETGEKEHESSTPSQVVDGDPFAGLLKPAE